jgi:hypothetical protein
MINKELQKLADEQILTIYDLMQQNRKYSKSTHEPRTITEIEESNFWLKNAYKLLELIKNSSDAQIISRHQSFLSEAYEQLLNFSKSNPDSEDLLRRNHFKKEVSNLVKTQQKLITNSDKKFKENYLKIKKDGSTERIIKI